MNILDKLSEYCVSGSFMRKINQKRLLLFTFILGIITIPFILNVKAQSNIPTNTLSTQATHQLKIYDFPLYGQTIYTNSTILNLTVQLLGPQADLSEVHSYYSLDQVNWVMTEFTKILTITDENVLFSGALGPFAEEGDYYLKINASRIIEQAKLTYRFTVRPVIGIVFLDFSYRFKSSDTDQYADVYVNVLGSDIKLGSVYVFTDQLVEGEDSVKMNLIAGSNITYRATIGPTNKWDKFFSVTFSAKTSSDEAFNSSYFYLLKESTNYVPEEFWSGKFPAIVVSAVIFGALTTAFVMSKRKPPTNYDIEEKHLKKKNSKKEVNKKNKEKEEDKL